MPNGTPVRVYADTSVYGGFFDDEFSEASRTFFEQIEEGRFQLVDSPLIDNELAGAPSQVRALHDKFSILGETASLTSAAVQLQQAYIESGIVSPKWETDALHVALATVTGCELIVSWNFKHIVHFEKISGYNEVNASMGFAPIRIHSPQEVITYED